MQVEYMSDPFALQRVEKVDVDLTDSSRAPDPLFQLTE